MKVLKLYNRKFAQDLKHYNCSTDINPPFHLPVTQLAFNRHSRSGTTLPIQSRFCCNYLFPCKWRILSSAADLCKQFGPRSGPTMHQAGFESKRIDTHKVIFLEGDIFLNVLYILKRNRNATLLNPLFLPHRPYENNFLIIFCFPAH